MKGVFPKINAINLTGFVLILKLNYLMNYLPKDVFAYFMNSS